ncbi:glycoside hydrolase superfamily [Clohesyomyces aquaticus]|uniref:glucan 1,3-beta-glucosidase n=1 Tax=Clohesyomyces aquaticus TaxID=1231657 RepID=A0A1Y1Y6C9_9PLEO|nr:glycoside hydrolase superfamily [Clohesyomyces aquaticus]
MPRQRSRDPDTDRERDRDPDRERRRRPRSESEHQRERERDRDRDPARERRHSRGIVDHEPPQDRDQPRDRDRERRKRRPHRATDSQGELLPRAAPPARLSRNYNQSDSERDSGSLRKKRYSTPATSTPSGRTASAAPLSLDALAKLDKVNQKKAGRGGQDYDEEYLKEVRRKEERLEKDRVKAEREEKKRDRERVKKMAGDAEAENRRRAYESDILVEEEARARKERRREERDGEKGKKRSQTDDEREERRRRHEAKYTPSEIKLKKEKRREEKRHRTEQKKRRLVSGPLLEEGGNDEEYEYQYMMEKRGGPGSAPTEYSEEELARRKKIKRIIIGVIAVILLLAIIIPVAILISKKNSSSDSATTTSPGNSNKPSNGNLNGISQSDIPDSAKGSILDPFTWYDTTDFNVTYTAAAVGGLPLMGLNSTWDNDVQANDKVPNLKDDFGYGKTPIRGVNVGGWLNLEPFITPSFFESFSTKDGVIDEWTYCTKMGATKCKDNLEKHYATFVNRQTFIDIRNAGFDHVRIPFGYWAVTTYDGDPYVSQISWRYLLRGIEYARQNGLRVNLDLHGAPGSQNGWNHSGRQGIIRWLNGTDGDMNAQRTLDIHHQLSQFFAQPRYKNIITLYGIVNEPRMVDLNTASVLSWTQKAINQIRKDNITAILVFGDGFLGLDNWKGKLQTDDKLLLDVHQYVIFNTDQISLPHTDKLDFACKGWTQQSKRSMDKTTGFGPTMCGEWSQADTDCTQYINNVGIGTRWEGTMNTGNISTSILKPQCPTNNNPTCSCAGANSDPGSYNDAYKKWLYQFAVAQMISFEAGWGWFYWTWDTEKAAQWSWKKGMKAGILPQKVWERNFSCTGSLEDYGKLGLPEFY